jgi:hypothetical protein
VLIASLGSSSDEFREELASMSEAVDREIAAHAGSRVLMAVGATSVSDLFAPHDPKLQVAPGFVLWVIDGGSIPLWLRDLEPFIAAMRRVARHGFWQHVFAIREQWRFASGGTILAGGSRELEPPGVSELERALSGAVPVSAVPDDGVFLCEVRRQGLVICGLRPKQPGAEAALSDSVPRHVVRAPRLRRLILDANTESGWTRLFEELLAREIAMHTIVNQDTSASPMGFPVGPLVPVYPDVSSVLQAMQDLNLLGSHSWGRFAPRELFKWAYHQTTVGIALNAYREPSTPNYLVVPRGAVAELAAGRIPKYPAD